MATVAECGEEANSREEIMQTLMRQVFVAAGLYMIVTATSAWAQQAQPVRVRGEITKVDGNTLSIKSRDGQNLTVKLADNARIAAMVKASLADIKEGAFIGVTGMPQSDGSQKAIGIHIFMDSQRGVVPDRFGPWDRVPGSTMTNANVATTVAGKDGQNLLVKYKDGEKNVVVPPNTPIARYTPGSASDLKIGAKVFVAAAQKQPDGSLSAPNIAVGRDIDPPQ
jgi:outer membrane lipoprotein SlyB